VVRYSPVLGSVIARASSALFILDKVIGLRLS
jgi:hypothetical protein